MQEAQARIAEIRAQIATLTPVRPAPAQGAASTETPAPAVTVARATNACFTDAALFTGTLVPREEIFVLAEVEGARIAEIMVEEGDTIRSGQPLARRVELGDGLFVAGDHRDTPSTQGALVSGRRAADAVLAHLGC